MNRTIILLFAAILVVLGGIFMLPNRQEEKTTEIPQLSLSPSLTNTPTPSIAPTISVKIDEVTKATIKTTKGDIEIEFYKEDAPKTVENFITKSANGFYNNLTFHRVEDWVVQGGDPLGNGTGGDDMATELNDKPFVVGAVGVARGPNIQISNDAQFFITKKDSRFLDNQYTNFGIVISGMDVVNKMAMGDKILGIEVE